MADIDGRFIIIKNVPWHRYSQCGEVSYSGSVVSEIEKIVEELKNVLTEIAIVDFAA